MLRNPTHDFNDRRGRVVGMARVLFPVWCVAVLLAAAAAAQPVHYPQHTGTLPPGAIGRQQLVRGGPLPGYFQPVEIAAPGGAALAMAVDGSFQEPKDAPANVGLLIGQVYRFRVTNIPLHEGFEVYPTIEVIDRLYPPPGKEHLYPIPVHITQQELVLALSGKLVTRVMYVEDPQRAIPTIEDPQVQPFFEVGSGENPVEVADRLGRPVAILRLGSRVPESGGPDATFLFGSPPLTILPARPAPPAPPPADDHQAQRTPSGEGVLRWRTVTPASAGRLPSR